MFGFFTNERFIAEVEVPVAGATTGPSTGSSTVLKDPAGPARPAAAAGPSMDDRMKELADLLGAASPDVDLYGRSGSVRTPAGATAAAAPAERTTPARTTSSPAGSSAGARSAARPARPASAAAAPVAAKPFTPAKHTLMLSAEDLVPTPAPTPVADEPSGPSPFAAALTRMVASSPVQAAAEDAAVAAAEAAAELAAVETAAAQAAAVEAATAEAARLATARIEAAAAEAARVQAEAARAEAARAEAARAEAARIEAARIEAARIEAARIDAVRLQAEAEAAAEVARLQAEAEAAAEAARIQAEVEAAAEAARIQAEVEAAAEAARIQAEAEAAAEAARLQAEAEAAAEAARVQAGVEAAAEAARIQAEAEAAAEAARIQAEAARLQAEAAAEAEAAAAAEAARAQAEAARAQAEAARVQAEAARVEAARLETAAPALSMVESVRSADEELADLLEEVLAANGSGRGRHRSPEAGAERSTAAADQDGDAAIAAASAIVESAAARAWRAPALAEDRVRDVPQPWACQTTAAEPNAYDTGAYRTDAHAGYASDDRIAQRAAQFAAAQNLVVDAVVVDESPAEEVRFMETPSIDQRARFAVPVALSPVMSPARAPEMARTASDPAPLPLDATTVLPPLSLMPPQNFGGSQPLLASRPGVPPVRRSRPPVPASTRPALSVRPQGPTRPTALPVAPRPAVPALPAADEPGSRLATVTRLVPAPSSTALAPYPMSGPEELVIRLLTLGLPDSLLGPDFTSDAAARGVYAALTRTLAERLPAAPPAPTEPGDVLMLVGPGAETFAAARSLASSLRLEPEAVLWAASGALAGLAPEASRITSVETALARRRTSATTGAVTVVAVDAPLRTSGGPWMEHMLSVWSPTAVWAVMDATRKPEDLVPWLDGLPRLDAVVVEDTDSTADPAAVLDHVPVPVAMVDGTRATAHRWASLLCERLEEMEA
ncbi:MULTISPECIES: hypothetical protein [unclassified Modestobacter]|uniref:hypothetical protein n=1 Tax=unclassified Modestobacter TaxID=2643866 RepID=UPI0022A9FB73|nr:MULTISPECIES: hypothetical protein [unclassified Modestobacter]MCZ2825127.1 hypothetical protein [Modestobacter sp. VKM Ac-2981]MCZ2853808.1 hypothetical protein [Modestobacter sp. VKM Ac-2982]